MRLSTKEIESKIVEKIDQDIQDSEVLPFPDDWRNYFSKHPVGSVLVQYASSRFAEPKAINAITQTRDLRFSVFVQRRNLREHSGIYPTLDAVRDSLTGFSVPGTSKIYQVSERFLDHRNGVWTYEMVFATQTTYEEEQ